MRCFIVFPSKQGVQMKREASQKLGVAGWKYASPAYWNNNLYMLSENETILLWIDPVGNVDKNNLMLEDIVVPCPQCNSENTSMTSQFGSTPCKSLYRCNSCLEPFDYFKCH